MYNFANLFALLSDRKTPRRAYVKKNPWNVVSPLAAMSSGLVRCVFDSFMETTCDSPRMHSAREFGRDILGRNELATADFSVELTTCLRGVFKPNVTYRSSAAKRDGPLFTTYDFLKFRVSGEGFSPPRLLARQTISRSLKCCLRNYSSVNFRTVQHGPTHWLILPEDQMKQTCHMSLSTDELNALRYACGYVPHNLLKKFQDRSGTKFDQFVECLDSVQ